MLQLCNFLPPAPPPQKKKKKKVPEVKNFGKKFNVEGQAILT